VLVGRDREFRRWSHVFVLRQVVRGCSVDVKRASYASQCAERTTMPFVPAIKAATPPPAGEEVTS
jgi:uncharacterized protein (DUF39 family)